MDKNLPQNILIVDDEKSNIDIIMGIFDEYSKDSQYNIITAISSKVALKTVEKRKIDLILLDIMIPQINGLEICKRIKSNDRTKNIPVIFITSKGDEYSIEKAFEVGGADYITKPFKPRELIARVRNQLHLKYLKDQEVQYSKNIALNELIHNIAHHWRQPLSVITGAAGTMSILKEMNSLEDDKFYDDCNTIVKTAEYLSSIIENFVNFNQNSSCNKFELFNIKQFIDENYNLLCLECGDINEVLDIDEDITFVSSPNQILQVILALITNAKDALNEVGVKEKIIFLNVKRKESNIIIEVYDSALGVRDEIINKVFEPYFTTKHKSQGKGLGLYSVKKIVNDILHGSVDIKNYSFTYKNNKLKGAKVTITLPQQIEV